MPALGADMETGTVVQWLVPPGARVKPGDVVAVVETHKGAIDVECFLDGVIGDLAPLGVSLPVGAVLARVAVAGEAGAASVAPVASPEMAAPVSPPAVTAPAPTMQAGPFLGARWSAPPRAAVRRRWACSRTLCAAPVPMVRSRWPMWNMLRPRRSPRPRRG